MPKKPAPKTSFPKAVKVPLIEQKIPTVVLIVILILVLTFSHLYIVRKYVRLKVSYYQLLNACQSSALAQPPMMWQR